METFIAILQSPAFVTLLAAGLAWGLKYVFTAKPVYEVYWGVILTGVRFAEGAIPNDTPNKSLAKLDAALQYVIKVVEAQGVTLTDADKTAIANAIPVAHSELEAQGSL